MVATLLRLRFRVLANSLRRNPVQLAAVIIGAVPVLAGLAAALIGLAVAAQAPTDLAQAAIVAGGTLLLLGWLLAPLLLDGVEESLDPRRLAHAPIRPAQLMTATVLASLAWVPGGATLVASAGTALAWSARPAVAAAAVATGVVGALTCVIGARAATGAAGALLRGGVIARTAMVGLVLLLVAAPLVPVVAAGAVGAGDPVQTALSALGVIAWTPFGAVWSIPGRLALGDPGGALGAAAIALATLIGLTLVWRYSLRALADSPAGGPSRSGGRRGLGALGWAPTGMAGAVGARSLVYWFRDARRTRQLLIIPAIPVAMLLWWRLLDLDAIALAIGPVVAALLPLSAFADLSYDGSAFASQLAAGTRGRSDRLGRAAALLAIGLPIALVTPTGIALLIGRPADLPALIGASAGVLLSATGVAAVSSALVVVPVPRAGRNPFATPAGSATMSILASYAVLGATLIASAPPIALAVAALVTGSAPLGWAALAGGLAVGAAALAGGILLGGRMLDRTAPALLVRLRLDRG